MLVSYFGEEEERTKNNTLANIGEIRESLEEHGVSLEIHENPHLHDRELRLDNGWTVKLGRGLDIYQKSKSNFR
jgi:ATP-dependent Lon protease